jgi:hypothetical protein
VLNDGLARESAGFIGLNSVAAHDRVSCGPQDDARDRGGAYTWPLHLEAWIPILMAL